MKKVFLLCLLIAVITMLMNASYFEKKQNDLKVATQYFVSEKYNEAYEEYEKNAKKGYVDAVYALMTMNYFGIGTSVDYIEAYKYYKLYAIIDSQKSKDDENYFKNLSEADKLEGTNRLNNWLDLCIKENNYLYMMYDLKHREYSNEYQLKILNLAAEHYEIDAQIALVGYYLSIKKSHTAAMWFLFIRYEALVFKNDFNIFIYDFIKEHNKKFTDEDLKIGLDEMFELLQSSSYLNNYAEMQYVGYLAIRDFYGKYNSKAITMLKKAADLNFSKAQYAQGEYYENYVKSNYYAYLWYKKAALNGEIRAVFKKKYIENRLTIDEKNKLQIK